MNKIINIAVTVAIGINLFKAPGRRSVEGDQRVIKKWSAEPYISIEIEPTSEAYE